MKLTNLTIKDLFTNEARLTFLVGAGCSVDAPSCLPAGRPMMEAIINYACAESEREKILKLEDLRFEQLVEIVRDNLDPELKIIDYYGQCDTPNLQHFFLAGMIKKGHFVMTTNFDFLIEYALLQSGVPKEEITPVITRQDFETYSNPDELLNDGKKPIYKIHGSTKNIITDENTRDSLIATIQAFGSGKEGESVFQVEPFKRSLFENISNNRTLVVMGYSGTDDFDIVPTLMILKNFKNIVWINYVPDDGGIENIYEIDDSIFQETKNSDKVNQILADIYRMRNVENIYRVNANTTRIIEELIDFKPNINSNNFSVSPITWFKNNINPPDEFNRYIIPYNIYHYFSLIDNTMDCSKIILKIAKKRRNKNWESLALLTIGNTLKKRGKLQKALEHYIEALAITEQLGDLQGKRLILNNIGEILKIKGKLNEALQHYKEALAIAEQLGDLEGKGTTLNDIGIILKSKGKLNEALDHYKEALAIADQFGDLWGKATLLHSIGDILKIKGELDEALQHYKEALAISEQLGDFECKVLCLDGIGEISEGRGKLDKALKLYQEALTIADQLDDLELRPHILNSIGLLLSKKGKLNKALRHYRKALAIDEQLGNLSQKGAVLSNIGEILEIKGKLDEALQHYKEALAIAEQLGELRRKAIRLNNIGLLLSKKGKLDKALKHYKEALAIFEQLGSPSVEITKENIEHLMKELK
ncbi:MAG: tetratricopeptide repeat protein [Promethearchaeota archaeon]